MPFDISTAQLDTGSLDPTTGAPDKIGPDGLTNAQRAGKAPLPDNWQPNGLSPDQMAGRAPLPPDFKPNGLKFDPHTAQLDTSTFDPATAQLDEPDYGAARNFLTGLLRVPGAFFGVPHVLDHAQNWLAAKVGNAITGGNVTADQLDQNSVAGLTPTPDAIDKRVFSATGATPYEPTSVAGKVGQAVVTGIGAGLVDPLGVVGELRSGIPALRAIANATKAAIPNALKTGAAAGTANVMTQAGAPPAVAAAAALLTHAGATAAEAAARGGGGAMVDATRQIVSPVRQGEAEAGRTLGRVDNSQPGLATPSASDLSGALGGVKTATDDIGPGLPDWQAGAQLRAGLQSRANTLKAARAASADQAYDAFRQQPPLPAAELEPFMRSPSFTKALRAANGAVLDEGGEPLTSYFDLADEDTPAFLTGRAIPTDVLHRVQSQLGDAVSSATPGSAAQRTATLLSKRFGNFLEQQYPARGDFPGYGAIRKNYAEASEPIDPMSYGPVEKTLDQDAQFGRSRHTLPDERIPDLFLRSNATRADLNQLVQAFGGDKDAATSALEQHLAGVAQSAVRPDGSLDATAFDKAMGPYQRAMPNLASWFPKLAGKFTTAKAAQATLDTLQAQRSLADAVSGGALRDQTGVVTGPSFNRWLAANKDALARTQSPAAVMRLQSIASALRSNPGELADALKSEMAPAALGMATGGLEGGVLGTLLHKFTGSAFGGLDAKRQEAFSAAIERATTDPAYAGRLAATATKRGRGVSPARALVRAIATTPLAVNAAAGSGQ